MGGAPAPTAEAAASKPKAGGAAEALFPLDLYSLAVAAEGEPPLVGLDAEADTADPVERAWAELGLSDALPWSRSGEEGGMDRRSERTIKNPSFALDSQLEDIIADDLVGRTWLEWSSDGSHQGREPGA